MGYSLWSVKALDPVPWFTDVFSYRQKWPYWYLTVEINCSLVKMLI